MAHTMAGIEIISSSEASDVDSDLEGAAALAMLVGSGSDSDSDADHHLRGPSPRPRAQLQSRGPERLGHGHRPLSPVTGVYEAHGPADRVDADPPSATMPGHGSVIRGNVFNPVVNVYGNGSTNVSLTYVEGGGPRATVTVQAPVTPGARSTRTLQTKIPHNANVLIRDTDPNDIATMPSASEGGPTPRTMFSQLGQGLNRAGKRKRHRKHETVRHLRHYFQPSVACGGGSAGAGLTPSIDRQPHTCCWSGMFWHSDPVRQNALRRVWQSDLRATERTSRA